MPTPSRLVRVFISSTFRDFIEERDLLVKRVFPELRQRCRKRFVEVLEVDLRWGITEDQSKSGETLRICLEEIDRCRPSAPVFFVGFLGERYGWIPPRDYFAQDVLENPRLNWVNEHIGGKSVTELEILHGVLNNEQMRNKAFFYLRKDGYQDRHWDAIMSYHEGIEPSIEVKDFTNDTSLDPQADVAKQLDLKRRVRDISFKWEPKDYETPQQMADLVLEDLWAAIDEVFPENIVPDENARHRLEHNAFAESRIRGYVPRSGLFDELDKILCDHTSVKAVIGESGLGKSALLAAWLRAREETLPQKRFIHFIGGTAESGTVESIVRRLMASIVEWGAVSDPIPDDLREAIRTLPSWLSKVAEHEENTILIVLDALNQLDNEYDRSLWWLPKQFPPGVKLLISTVPGSTENILRDLGFLKESVILSPLQDDEKRTIITSYLAIFSKTINPDLLDRLVKAHQCANPLFLRVVLDELRLRASHETLTQNLDRMLEANDATDLYVQVLKGLKEFNRDRPNLVRESLGYIATARRGLTESELLQLLSESPNPSTTPLPRRTWSPLYLAIADSLVSRNGQLGFFHDYLRQAVEREYLDEHGERKKIHGKLGDIAQAWDTDRYSPTLRNYGLEHGAAHLRLAGRHADLVTLSLSHHFHEEQRKTSGMSAWTTKLLENALASSASQPTANEQDWEKAVEIVAMAHAQAEQRTLMNSRWIIKSLLEDEIDKVVIRRMIEVITCLDSAPRFLFFVSVLWKLESSGNRDALLLIEETMQAFVSFNLRDRDWCEWIDDRLLGWLVARLRRKIPSIDFLEEFSTASRGHDKFMSDYVMKLEVQENGQLSLDAFILVKSSSEMDTTMISEALQSKFLSNQPLDPDHDLDQLLYLAEQACALPANERDLSLFDKALENFELIVQSEEDDILFKLSTIRIILNLDDAEGAFARALAASGKAASGKKNKYWRSRALNGVAQILARQGHSEQALRVAREFRDSTYLSEILLLIQMGRENDAFSVFCETLLWIERDDRPVDKELRTTTATTVSHAISSDFKAEADDALKQALAREGVLSSIRPEEIAKVAVHYADKVGTEFAENALAEALNAVSPNDIHRIRTLIRIARSASEAKCFDVATHILQDSFCILESIENLSDKIEQLGILLLEINHLNHLDSFKNKVIILSDSLIEELGRDWPEDGLNITHIFGKFLQGLVELGEWERFFTALHIYQQHERHLPERIEEWMQSRHAFPTAYLDRLREIITLFAEDTQRQRILIQFSMKDADLSGMLNAVLRIRDRDSRSREITFLTKKLCRSGKWRDAIQMNPWHWISHRCQVKLIECYCEVAEAALKDNLELAIRFTIKSLTVSYKNIEPHDLSIADSAVRNTLAAVAAKCSKYTVLRRLLQRAKEAGLLEVCLMAFLTQPDAIDRFCLRRLLRWMPLKHELLSAWLVKARL
jgi:hypothetical protein